MFATEYLHNETVRDFKYVFTLQSKLFRSVFGSEDVIEETFWATPQLVALEVCLVSLGTYKKRRGNITEKYYCYLTANV